MKTILNIIGVLSAIYLSAASAFAFTVTITHSGLVAFNSAGPVPTSGTLQDGDQLSFSYDLDIDPALITSFDDPFESTRELNQITTVHIEASSGFKTEVAGAEAGILLNSVYGNNLSVSAVNSQVDLQMVHSNSSIPIDVFELPVDQMLSALSYQEAQGNGNFTGIFVDPVAIGLASDTCSPTFGCYFESLFDWQTTASLATATPPVSAVPVPAPFLMLGMAMLGLVGLGRKANA